MEGRFVFEELCCNCWGIGLNDLFNANVLLSTLGGLLDSATQTFNIKSRTSGFVNGAPNLRHLELDGYSFFGQDQWKAARSLTLTRSLSQACQILARAGADDGL